MLTVEEKDIVLNLIKKICLNKDTYFNTFFGSDENKLCIDGCIEYESEEEKAILIKWVTENGLQNFNVGQ